jgi:putative hemolysin
MLAPTGRQRKVPGWPHSAQRSDNRPTQGRARPAKHAPAFRAQLLHDACELRAAERLRQRVFGPEYAARTSGPAGRDRDAFDPHCLHMGVRDERHATLAGYTRVLPDDRLQRTGGFYAAREFELGMVARLPGRVAELGRTCTHPEYRGGALMAMLWSRLAEELQTRGIRFVVGCASVPLNGPGDPGAVIEHMRGQYPDEPEWRVHPKRRAPVSERVQGEAVLPALLKTCLQMGARVCGEPCWDPDFRCLDYLVLLDLEALSPRYGRRFLRPAKEAV